MSLNEKQKAFAEYYVTCFNAAEAARKAGYSEKTARTIGNQLLSKLDIANYIQEHANKAHNKRIATANEVLEYLSETMKDESETRRERTKAAELLGKRYGLFVEREIERDRELEVKVTIEDFGGDNEG